MTSGCSSTGAFSLSKETEPYPSDYRRIVESNLGRTQTDRMTGVQISRPQVVGGWSILDPASWYVCLRNTVVDNEASVPAAGSSFAVKYNRVVVKGPHTIVYERVFLLSGGKVSGILEGPAPHFCDNVEYEIFH